MTLASLDGSADLAPRGVFALLSDRTFGPFFFGNLTSNVGQWFQNLTAAVVVFELSGSSLLVGTVSVAQFAATLLLAPYVGPLTDRVDRRKLLLGGQAVAFASASALAVLIAVVGVEGLPGAWPVLAATFGMGVGYAFSTPAMQALVPALVPPQDLEQAIALNSITFHLARAAGPALAGVTLVAVGPAAAFTVNAVTYVPLLTALLVIRPRPLEWRLDGDRSLRAALRHVRSDPASALLLAGVAAIGFASDPVNTLTPGMAALLGGGGGLVSAFVAAFGAGAAVMMVLIGRVRRRWPQATVATAGLAVTGLGILSFSWSPVAGAALASLAVAGAGFLMAITALTTLLQRRVPEEMRGRVMALWAVAFLGTRPMAAALDGVVADTAGPRIAGAVAASFALVAAVVATQRSAILRDRGQEA